MTFSSFIKSAIARDDNLFTQIYRFNELVSEYIDKSHLESFPDLMSIWDSIKNVKRIQKKLSKLLLKYLKLENKSFYAFEEPRLRIALLDSKTLNDLLVYTGAVIYSELISKIILKNDVVTLKESIGENIYFFATKKASLLIGFAPKISLIRENQAITKSTLFEGGKKCLQLCLAREDEGLLERLILKFPEEIQWDFTSEIVEEQKTKAWNLLYKILIKEVNPEAKKCFI